MKSNTIQITSDEHQLVSVWWLRRDLRIIDNTALFNALKGQYPVLLVFIFDTAILNHLSDKKDKRVNFIYQALLHLDAELKKQGSSLFILHDTPLAAFQKLCNAFDVKRVFTNHDYEPYAIERDARVKEFLGSKNISFLSFKDQVIFERSEIMKPDKTPYTVFTPYSVIWKKKLDEEKIKILSSEKLLSNLLKTKSFHFPTLEEIGFEKGEVTFEEPNISEEAIHKYHETRNLPSIEGTSQMSVHLRFGTISIRKLVNLAGKLNEKWLNELIWREFFMMILFHFPPVVDHNFKKKYDAIQWRNNEKEFELWCKGETGYPIVDAGMRQLNETGWMHNRVRMITAGFLCKHLLIDWRWGEAYFAGKLLDYELSSNNGNWQWAAGTGCDAAPYFRIFNPETQIKKFDPKLIYIKKWIKDFRPDYINEVVKHEFARKRALGVYKKALEDS
ncbi:MAG: DNA photolyase family protein [Bacteroidota bacterium]|nr:DNA photolyase family protein [Bacteroidota bacterium]